MRGSTMTRLAGAALAILMTLYATGAHADVITDWNQNTLEVLKVANIAGNPWSRHGDGAHRDVRRRQFRPAAVHALCSGCSRHASWRRAPCGRPIRSSFCIGDAPMAEQQTATCRECSRTISPGDTLVFGYGRLGHLVCRRPRVLSAEERTLLFLYCRDHPVAECIRCAGKFHLREVASIDQFGIRSHGCPWCHTDLTDSIRAHLYGCAMLPVGGTTQGPGRARGGAKPGEAEPSAA